MATYDNVLNRQLTTNVEETGISLGSSLGAQILDGDKTNVGGSEKTFTSATTSIEFKTYFSIWYFQIYSGTGSQVVYEVTNSSNRPDATPSKGTVRGFSITKNSTFTMPGYLAGTTVSRVKCGFYDTNPSQSGTKGQYDYGVSPSYPFSWFAPYMASIKENLSSIGGHPTGSYENWYIHNSIINYGVYCTSTPAFTGINFGNGNSSFGSMSNRNINDSLFYLTNPAYDGEITQCFWYKDTASGNGVPGFGGFVCLSLYNKDNNIAGVAPLGSYVEINGQVFRFTDTRQHQDPVGIAETNRNAVLAYMWHVPDSVIDSMNNNYASNANKIRFYNGPDVKYGTGIGTAFGKSNSNIKMSELRRGDTLFSSITGNSTARNHLKYAIPEADSVYSDEMKLGNIPSSGTIRMSDFEGVKAPIWCATGSINGNGADGFSDYSLDFLNSSSLGTPYSAASIGNITFTGLFNNTFTMSLNTSNFVGFSGRSPRYFGIINNSTNEPIFIARVVLRPNAGHHSYGVQLTSYYYRNPDFTYNPYDPPAYFLVTNLGNYPDNTSITLFFA